VSKTRGPRQAWRALALGVVGLALTGCAGLHPGVAVEVGEQTITVDEVDAVAEDFCTAIEPQLEAQAESVQNSYFRGGIAGTLAMREIAEQVAAEYGVEPDNQDYRDQLAEIERGVTTLPESVQESVVTIETAPLYVDEVQALVGEQVLDGEGEREDLVAAGQEEFAAWVAENGVEFDPSLNTVIRDGTIANQDRAVSFAVSEAARNGLEQQPNSVLARQTPDSHRCGR
jgi:hypothetical protein